MGVTMTDNSQAPDENGTSGVRPSLAGAFTKTINSHGYGFQYAVLNKARDLHKRDLSAWVFQVAEFPVSVKGSGTRIDFILGHRHAPICLLAECKRANPALGDWCFARAPLVRRNRPLEHMFLESAEGDTMELLTASAQKGTQLDNAFHIALEVRSGSKGDPSGSGRGAVEEAATQLCRGLNGMVEFLAGHPASLLATGRMLFLPVVFTTARLWVSNADLAAANLSTGDISLAEDSVIQKDWIFYQYHQSPGIKHNCPPGNVSPALGELLDAEYIRSIAIVSSTGVEDFLRWSSDEDHFTLV
jgi:hypothetical protein